MPEAISIFAEQPLQVIGKNKITRIELNNEDANNKYARLELSKVISESGVTIKKDLIKEIIVNYTEDRADDTYDLKNPETDEVVGQATFAEFLMHVYSFAVDVTEKEMAKAALEEQQRIKVMEDMEKQRQLQEKRAALAEEYQRKQAELEASSNLVG